MNIERKFKTISTKIDDGPPARYQLKIKRLNLDKLSDEDSNLRRFTVGKRNPKYPNKTVLLVGATGSGKSTLINALVNFVMGVKFEDKVWFEIVPEEKNKESQAQSQTTAVSVYEVFGFEGKTVPYSLTIIDTPGYRHTRGIEHDDINTKKLQDLFCVADGVKTVDAVGLVLNSTENRLDERLANFFNSVTSLFGRDMKQNIVALMTYSHNRIKPKNAIQALEDAKIKCARDKNNELVYFCFDNCQKEQTNKVSEAANETSEDGMKRFTEFLGQCPAVRTTVEVLRERTRLTACIQNLKEIVETIQTKQDAIKWNKIKLSKYEKEMKKNQDFIIDVEDVYRDKVTIQRDLLSFQWFPNATTCNKCKENCHYPGCTWAWSSGWCEVIKDGNCTSCTGKCPVADHVKEDWRYVTKTRTMKKTIKEMKAKYEENKAQSEETTSLVEDMEKEMATLQEEKNQFLDEAFQIIVKLEEIALKADSVFTYVHLEFLMEKMKERGDTEKVKTLERMRDRMDDRNKAGANYLKNIFKK